MTAATEVLRPARPSGNPFQRRIRELACVLFADWRNAATTVLCMGLFAWGAAGFWVWGWRDATFVGDAAACRAAGGACWAFVAAKLDFAVFGFYPFEERWRASMALVLLAAMIGGSLIPRFWKAGLLAAWAAMLVAVFVLLRGGLLGLSVVPVRLWSGIVVTVWLSVLALAVSYPVGLALALGRRSEMRLVRWFAIGWIEIVRGVPLVSILIMAAIVMPLFLPEGTEVENLLRAQVAFTLFGSAYLAEVFRGGLQAIPDGQHEGAKSLGLGYWQMLGLVVLPQALKLVIPAQVNTFIAIFKDASLVLVIGLFDFLGTIKAMLSDTAWLGFATEAYLFAAVVYFAVCYGMSVYSRYLERMLNPERQR